MNNVNINIASFKEAFSKFISYSDGSLNVETIASFSELKEKGTIEYRNAEVLWNGNHCSSNEFVELHMVETPCRFYVVKYIYIENSSDSHRKVITTVFVPNEA